MTLRRSFVVGLVALAAAVLAPAALAYVTPSHQFPVGGVLSAGRRRALLDWAARNGAVIVEDDYDGEYRHGVAPIPPLRALAPDCVVYVGSLSKLLLQGQFPPKTRIEVSVDPVRNPGVFGFKGQAIAS